MISISSVENQKSDSNPNFKAGNNEAIINLENVEKRYRTDTVETIALHNINIKLLKGEFISIMGPSGCGKSTLLNVIGLLDHPSSGTVTIDGCSLNNLNDRTLAKFRNKKLGFIFQSFHLINDLNVIDNVELPLLYRKTNWKLRKKAAMEALEKVGLSNRMHHYPSQLSGGQKQRVAIARAITGNPEIILADEPTGNLDSNMGNEIMDILLELNKNEGRTIIMVTHDELMAKKTNRLIRLFDGTQVQ